MVKESCCSSTKTSCDCGIQNGQDVRIENNSECGCCSCSSLEEDNSEIYETDSVISFENRIDHISARLGIRRLGHTIRPGLYRIGNPHPESKVFVTANYTLSFDALRSSLSGFDAWILVLETYGINVWCAAGKGTFGTDELTSRIKLTGLPEIVNHREIILPRLAAPGVNANEVYKRSGFHVIWGTIRSSDIPEYLKTGIATPEMKRVRFPLKDRLVLTPVEIRNFLPYILIPSAIFLILGMWQMSAKLILSFIAGTVLFPALLFVIPSRDFTIKGLILGYIVIIPVMILEISGSQVFDIRSFFTLASDLLIWPAVIAFLALNFTGSTTFASRSGVKKEIKRYTRPVLAIFISGVILASVAGLMGVVL